MPAPRKDYPEAVALYQKGLSIADVAGFYGITRQSMHKWFKRREVEMRDNLRHGSENHFHRGGVTQDMRARTIYRVALRNGILSNPKACAICSSEVHVSGHHDDYSKPLDVRWLCHRCHYEWHQNNTALGAVDLPPPLSRQEIGSMGGKASRTPSKRCQTQKPTTTR